MLRYRAPALALALAALAVPAAAAPLSPAQQGRVDAIARKQLAAQHISGLTIGIGRNGKVLFARGYGLRDRAGHLAADAFTVYAIGSITKQFTASAVWLLAQQHRVGVDAPLSHYLPDIPHSQRVTVLELLDQISGYRDYLEDDALLKSIENSTVGHHTIAYYAGLGAGTPLEFPPGSKWAYSNTNYALLGLLIQRVSGQTYWNFLQDDVLRSRLPNTTYLTMSLPPGNDSSQGYTYGKASYALVKPYDMSWANAAGALASTVSDLVVWDGLYFGGKIIDAATLRTALDGAGQPPDGGLERPAQRYRCDVCVGMGPRPRRGPQTALAQRRYHRLSQHEPRVPGRIGSNRAHECDDGRSRKHRAPNRAYALLIASPLRGVAEYQEGGRVNAVEIVGIRRGVGLLPQRNERQISRDDALHRSGVRRALFSDRTYAS